MTDLHARLLAAVQQRMDTARAVRGRAWKVDAEPWANGVGVVDDSVDVGVAAALGSYIADHIAANDPATVIRHCERDLRVLERHRPIEPGRRCGCEWWLCWCGEHARWPCAEVTELAAAYGIEVDG